MPALPRSGFVLCSKWYNLSILTAAFPSGNEISLMVVVRIRLMTHV